MAMVFMTSVAWAAPFLVCDGPPAAEQVTGYEIFQDGVSLGTTPAPMMFDLQGVTPGAYEFTAIAINAWGVSSASNPYLLLEKVAPPLNLRVIP